MAFSIIMRKRSITPLNNLSFHMNTIMTKLIRVLLLASLSISLTAAKTVKVFLLAGQSNMEGQGVVDMDHPKYYNGGKGTLLRVMKNSSDPKRYAHLKDKKGNWVVRDDAFIRFRNKQGVMAGGVSIGFTGYGSDKSRHHIGPELQIGHRLGDHLDHPQGVARHAHLLGGAGPPGRGEEAFGDEAAHHAVLPRVDEGVGGGVAKHGGTVDSGHDDAQRDAVQDGLAVPASESVVRSRDRSGCRNRGGRPPAPPGAEH